MLPGYIPAAKTLLEGHSMAGLPKSVRCETPAPRTRQDGLYHQTRDMAGIFIGMTIHAPLRTLDPQRPVLFRNIEDVIDAAQFGVQRHDLDAAPGNVADIH